MGLFDNIKINKMGQNALNVHVSANDLLKRGKVAEARAKYAEAMERYQKAYQAGCRKTGVLISYSVLMMRSGLFAEARELMKEIAQDKSMSEDTHFELRMNYSICLWRLGLTEKAIETARYAGNHCKNSTYYGALGTYLVDQAGKTGEFEEAKAFLEEAMEYDDEDSETLDNLGEYHRLLSLRAEGEEREKLRKTAKSYFIRARKAKPSQITTLYALAKFCQEEGDIAKARELVDRAIIHSSSKICPVSMEDLQKLKAELQ